MLEESASLTLSEQDYRTLYDRHQQLVARLEEECLCREQEDDFDALERLSQLLESLQELDLGNSDKGTPAGTESVLYASAPTADLSMKSADQTSSSAAVEGKQEYLCGDSPIVLSNSPLPLSSAARAMLRGHFSHTIVDSLRKLRTVTEVPCVIKCAVRVEGSAAEEPLEASVAALRYEHSIYELIQERSISAAGGTTGCVHCYSAHPSYHYLVLEDHGQDITQLFHPSYRYAIDLAISVVTAVLALHSLGVMHGDIKPANFVYTHDRHLGDVVKLCDLESTNEVGADCDAAALGSPQFLAPEVYHACQRGTPTVKAALEIDMFALGLVLWQVLQRSIKPALPSDTTHATLLHSCYTDQQVLWDTLELQGEGEHLMALRALTSLDPSSRKDARWLKAQLDHLSTSKALLRWMEKEKQLAALAQRCDFLEHHVVSNLKSVEGKVDTANAKLDTVLEVLQSKFDALGQEVVGVAATLRKEMLLGREQGQVLEGLVQATQDTLQQLSMKASGADISSNSSLNGDQMASLLSTLQFRIEGSVTAAVSQQQPSSPSQAALTEMSAQFRAQFSALSADLQVLMEDQRRAQATSSATLQDQQKQAQQMQQCLTSSLQDVLSGLSAIKQEVVQLRQGQEQLGREVTEVLTRNTELAAMVSTLISGTHSIPTLAIILPVVSNSWRSLLSPMRLVRNEFRLYFLCSHTHRIAPCGPKGNGYKITVTKQWVQDAAPVLRVGLVLVKLALLSAGLPLPVPDLPALLSASGLHAKYLDAALHLVQNPDFVTGAAEYVMDKAIDKLESFGENIVLQEKGGMALQEGSRNAYETIQEVLRKDGVNIALTSGLRQVTHGGKTAWVLDSDDVVAQFKATW